MSSGLPTGLAALAAAELTSVPVRPEASPVTAVGGAVIDRTPAAVKDFAIRTFGSQDKLALQLGIVALLVLFALSLGLLALRHRRTGAAGVLLFGVVGAAAAVERPDAGPVDALPSVVGALVGAGVLYLLAGRLARPAPRDGATAVRDREVVTDGEDRPTAGPGSVDRRGFALAAGAVVAGSAGAGLLGSRLGASRRAQAAASRASVVLPAPASRAAPTPRGADLGIDGMEPYLTPVRDFYRVDTALIVPRVDASPVAAARPRTRSEPPVDADLRRPAGPETDRAATSRSPASPTRSAVRTRATPAGSACGSRICCARPESGRRPGAARPISSWPAPSTG